MEEIYKKIKETEEEIIKTKSILRNLTNQHKEYYRQLTEIYAEKYKGYTNKFVTILFDNKQNIKGWFSGFEVYCNFFSKPTIVPCLFRAKKDGTKSKNQIPGWRLMSVEHITSITTL